MSSSRMTHEEKDALVVRLRERIAELADLLVESGERIKKQSERIAELELRLGCCRDASTGKDLLIAELEAQVPKVVKPEPRDAGRHDGLPETYWLCSCGCYDIYPGFAYCSNCGSKLNWKDS